MAEKYTDKLWGKIEFLHNRYKKNHLYLTNLIEITKIFQNACFVYSKELSALTNKTYQFTDKSNTSLTFSLESLLSNFSLQVKEYNELFNTIKTQIFDPLSKKIDDNSHKEKEMYNSYIKSRNVYNSIKTTLEKTKKDYENSVKTCEKNIFNCMQLEMNSTTKEGEKYKNINKASGIIVTAKTLETKYLAQIEEANKARISETTKQTDLLNYYQNVDTENYNNLKCNLCLFIASIKKLCNSVFSSIEIMSSQYNHISIENDINNFLEENKSELKPDSVIEFEPYNPEASLLTDAIACDLDECEKLNVNFEVICSLQRNFKDVRKDLNMDFEYKKNRLRILTIRIFKIGQDTCFTEDEKDELLSYMKFPEFRKYFIVTLSKQRIKSRYQRSKLLILELADILNFILKYNEQEKNYEIARNCIIISQTFYFEVKNKDDDQKYKKYLFEYIVNNKTFKTFDFWEGIIEYMIQVELTNSEQVNKQIIENETPEEKKLRISNIAFSQLLPYANNMVEFYINKDDIIDLVSSFVKKYEIDKTFADTIYENIKNTNPKKIEIDYNLDYSNNNNENERTRSFSGKRGSKIYDDSTVQKNNTRGYSLHSSAQINLNKFKLNKDYENNSNEKKENVIDNNINVNNVINCNDENKKPNENNASKNTLGGAKTFVMNVFRLSKFIDLNEVEKIEDIKKNENNKENDDFELTGDVDYLKQFSKNANNKKDENNLNNDEKDKDIYDNVNEDEKNEKEENK